MISNCPIIVLDSDNVSVTNSKCFSIFFRLTEICASNCGLFLSFSSFRCSQIDGILDSFESAAHCFVSVSMRSVIYTSFVSHFVCRYCLLLTVVTVRFFFGLHSDYIFGITLSYVLSVSLV